MALAVRQDFNLLLASALKCIFDTLRDPKTSNELRTHVVQQLVSLRTKFRGNWIRLILRQVGQDDVVFDIRSRWHRSAYPELYQWRKRVLARDGFACQDCGARTNLEAHHIHPWSTHPDLRTELDNGQTLCRSCHLAVTITTRKYGG